MSTATKSRDDTKSTKKSDKKDSADEEKRRPNLAERAPEWEPDPSWFHPFVGALATYTLGGVPVWAELPQWATIPPGLGLTGAAMWAASRAYSRIDYGKKQERRMTWLTALAGSASTSWAYWASNPDVTPLSPSALGTLILGSVGLGSVYASWRQQATEKKNDLAVIRREHEIQHHERQLERIIEERTNTWDPILKEVGLEDVRVYDWSETKSGECLHLIDSPTKPVRLEGLQNAIGPFSSLAAHLVAKQGINLQADDVRVEQGEAAHLFRLYIDTKRVFAGSFEYPERGSASIMEPLNLGYYKTGEDLALTLYENHIYMVGATGSGKDVFNNNIIAECTRRRDVKVQVAGTDKLIPAVWPWIEPWLRGDTTRPILDRVAGEDPNSVLRCLRDLYKIGKLRNKKLGRYSKHKPTPEDPAYVLVLVEAADFLRDHGNESIKLHDGRSMTGSKLVDAITRGFRSAGIMVVATSQYGLMDGAGSHGSYMMRNFTARICGKTMTHSDGTNTLVGLKGVNTTKLRDHTLLVQPNKEEPRVTPAKVNHIEATEDFNLIDPVVIRHTQYVPGTPKWILDALADFGTDFETRWSRHHHPDLAALAEDLGLEWPSLGPAESATLNGTDTSNDEDNEAPETSPEPVSSPKSTFVPEYPQMSTEEIESAMQKAEEKFAEARADLERWGVLGETMNKVHEAVRAANAPDWIGAGRLAWVIDRVEEGDSPEAWDDAASTLIAELSGPPWKLAPETGLDGEKGWRKDAILAAVRGFLHDGEPGDAVPTPRSEPTVPDHPLAHAAQVVQGRDMAEIVATSELARLMGRVTTDMDDRQIRSEVIKVGTELSAFVEKQRGRDFNGYMVKDILAASANKVV